MPLVTVEVKLAMKSIHPSSKLDVNLIQVQKWSFA